MLMGLFSCGQMSEREHLAVDSLNTLAHEAAYRSLDEAMGYVDEVLGTYGASNYTDGMHEAWLIRGDVYGMKMDYDSARVCYQKVHILPSCRPLKVKIMFRSSIYFTYSVNHYLPNFS